MALRTILVPVRGDGLGEGLLDHALALSRKSDAHIEVIHCRARPEDMIPFGVFLPASMREQIKSAAGGMADTEEAQLRPLFDAYARDHDLEVVDAPPWPIGRASISWRERTGKQPNIVSVHGRLADLIVVPKPDPAINIGFNTLEAALFSTGRPVVMCPARKPGTLGAHVAVAWNGSAEAARMIATAIPVLAGADKVTVLSVGSEVPDEIGADALVSYLGSHDISAEAVVRQEGRIAQTLLGECDDRGVDMLMMGAYGQSRQLEMVMGGVTQHIVEHAAIPVLLSH